jgi:hypothetical protein
MSGTNGVSYQNGGATNGASTPTTTRTTMGGWKKGGIALALVTVLGVAYSALMPGLSLDFGSSSTVHAAAIAKTMTESDLSFDRNGKLKLFDAFSK